MRGPRQRGDHPLGYFSPSGVVAHSSSWSPAAYGHGTLPVEDVGQGDFFQDGDEEEEDEDLEMFDESIKWFALSGWRPRRLCCDYMAGCCAGGWGCTFAHGASKSFTRHPFLEHFVDVPVPQITDELLDEADAAVKGSGVAVGVQLCSRCSSLARQGVRRYSAEVGDGTQALAARRWGGGFSAPG